MGINKINVVLIVLLVTTMVNRLGADKVACNAECNAECLSIKEYDANSCSKACTQICDEMEISGPFGGNKSIRVSFKVLVSNVIGYKLH
ncbi:unnamed protein product [Amaranthus hypochondriacus]